MTSSGLQGGRVRAPPSPTGRPRAFPHPPENAGRPEGPAFPEGVRQISEGKKSEQLPLHSPGAVPASVLGLSRIFEAILEAVSKEESPFLNPERWVVAATSGLELPAEHTRLAPELW